MDDASLILTCPTCLTKNRIPAERAGDEPTCGKCGKALLDGGVIHLTDANFKQVTEMSDIPVLVDFWAPWCGPCKAMAPQFEKAARELKGRALLVKVDIDQNARSSVRYRIKSIPTVVKLDKGVEVGRTHGAVSAAEIIALAERSAASRQPSA
jgi:thioredoxin 2